MTDKTEVEDVTDLVGMPLSDGDFLAQAYNLGRCAALKFSRIVSVNSDKSTLRVIGCAKNWRGEWELNRKPYNINFPERSIWIKPESTPAIVNKLLTEAYDEFKYKEK